MLFKNKFNVERDDFIRGEPKRDGSGKGLKLNEGRGGCEIIKRGRFNKK